MLNKNVSGQGIYILAVDASVTPAVGKEGDSANITATLSKDGGAEASWNSGSNPTEIGGGIYWCDFTQDETNADSMALIPESTTTSIVIKPCIITTDGGVFVRNNLEVYTRMGNSGDDDGIPAGEDTDSLEDIQAIVANTPLSSYTTDGTLSEVLATVKVLTDKLEDMLALNGEGTEYQYTTDALENGPSATASGDIISVNGVSVTDIDDFKADVSGVATPAQVNAEVLDVLSVDTFAEPGKEAPDSTASLVTKIGYLFKSLINKKDSDGSTESLYNSDGVTVDQEQTVSDDETTSTKGAMSIGS